MATSWCASTMPASGSLEGSRGVTLVRFLREGDLERRGDCSSGLERGSRGPDLEVERFGVGASCDAGREFVLGGIAPDGDRPAGDACREGGRPLGRPSLRGAYCWGRVDGLGRVGAAPEGGRDALRLPAPSISSSAMSAMAGGSGASDEEAAAPPATCGGESTIEGVLNFSMRESSDVVLVRSIVGAPEPDCSGTGGRASRPIS